MLVQRDGMKCIICIIGMVRIRSSQIEDKLLYHNMKDYDKAIEFYKKTIEVDPNYAEAIL